MKRNLTRPLYFCMVLFICVLSGCVNDGSRPTSLGETAEDNSSADNPIATIAALENALATAEFELEVGAPVGMLAESAIELAGEPEVVSGEDTATAVANVSRPETPDATPSVVEVRPNQGGSLNFTEAIPAARLSLSTASTSRPSDILDEMAFFGGGGGCPCFSATPQVSDCVLAGPDYFWPYTGNEFHAGVNVTTCGWQPDESIFVTVQFPDGNSLRHSARSSAFGALTYIFLSQPNPPEGVYEFNFDGASGEVSYQTLRTRSASPTVFGLSYYEYMLYGFQANERVRLAAYQIGEENNLEFWGWQEFYVNDDGQLLVEIEESIPIFGLIAYGDQSGTVNQSGPLSDADVSELLAAELRR